MRSVAMDNTADPESPPDLIATVASHLLIGLVVATVTKSVFRQKFTVAIVAGLLAFGLHQNFDAPVARKLSQLGL
jgi:hypothetical protein